MGRPDFEFQEEHGTPNPGAYATPTNAVKIKYFFEPSELSVVQPLVTVLRIITTEDSENTEEKYLDGGAELHRSHSKVPVTSCMSLVHLG